LTVKLGESASFYCKSQGNLAVWLFGSTPLYQSSHIKFSYDKWYASEKLEIMNVKIQQVGKYTCQLIKDDYLVLEDEVELNLR